MGCMLLIRLQLGSGDDIVYVGSDYQTDTARWFAFSFGGSSTDVTWNGI